MSSTPDPREERVNAALAEYLDAAGRGAPFDRAAWLAQHADLRPELEAFLADQEAFTRAAAPVQPPTVGYDEPSAAGPLGTVKYFGDYELLEEVARGGMGVVFRARQVSLNRVVALKMILKGELATPADVQRFRQEAEAAAALDHPNIVPIYEIGDHEGQQYFSMKFIEGGSLSSLATLRRSVRSETLRGSVAQVLIPVARAVHFAHQRGVLHRDLKPPNILIDADGIPYVADFGLAKRVGTDGGVSQSGAAVGTPNYMAPEQARAERSLTTAVDVWALGAILYELLTGRPPFRGDSLLETLRQVQDREPADPRALNPLADSSLAVIALKCLAKDPSRRYGRGPGRRPGPLAQGRTDRGPAGGSAGANLAVVPPQPGRGGAAGGAVADDDHRPRGGDVAIRALAGVVRGIGTAPPRGANTGGEFGDRFRTRSLRAVAR